MKRYAFLTVIFLMLVVAILLSSCTSVLPSTPAAPAGEVVSATQTAPLPVAPTATQPKPAADPTSLPTQSIPVTSPTQAPMTADAEVSADGLNLRLGPGLNHRILGVLTSGQKVRLEGRSQASDWVVVRLADGTVGWVFAAYLRTNTNLASLPMLEAYGGPVVSEPEAKPTSKPARRYTLNMSIDNNEAEVDMAGFPADRELTLRLAVPAEDLAMTVATVKTNAEGKASVSFEMPTNWPDGSAVTQNALLLQAFGPDGKLLGSAKITYYSAE